MRAPSDPPDRDTPAERAKKPLSPRPSAAEVREDRLKAALKANMARRKAQAKARATQDGDSEQSE